MNKIERWDIDLWRKEHNRIVGGFLKVLGALFLLFATFYVYLWVIDKASFGDNPVVAPSFDMFHNCRCVAKFHNGNWIMYPCTKGQSCVPPGEIE